MGFEKGHRKIGGRQKGAVNKKSEACTEICERLGINPFEALLKMTEHADDNLRFQALKEVCKYVYPQKKAIEHTGKDGGAIEVDFNPYKDMSEEELDKCLSQAKKK